MISRLVTASLPQVSILLGPAPRVEVSEEARYTVFIRYLRIENDLHLLKVPRPPFMARSTSNPQLVLRPQDLMVLLRLSLVTEEDEAPGYAALAADLGLTASEAHGAVERAVAAQLAVKDSAGRPRVRMEPLRLFVLHGARYSFPATRGPLTRGLPTSHGAAPLNALIRVSATDPLPVWPDKDGAVRGETLYPLYPTAPQAARGNPALHELLALFDAIRAGSPRERALAIQELDKRWRAEAPATQP